MKRFCIAKEELKYLFEEKHRERLLTIMSEFAGTLSMEEMHDQMLNDQGAFAEAIADSTARFANKTENVEIITSFDLAEFYFPGENPQICFSVKDDFLSDTSVSYDSLIEGIESNTPIDCSIGANGREFHFQIKRYPQEYLAHTREALTNYIIDTISGYGSMKGTILIVILQPNTEETNDLNFKDIHEDLIAAKAKISFEEINLVFNDRGQQMRWEQIYPQYGHSVKTPASHERQVQGASGRMGAKNRMSLFSDDFADITRDEEIAALAEQHKYDRAYICQGWVAIRRKTKEWLEALWTQYEPYADTHFLDDFKKQFTQRVWEMYLGITLLNRGFKLGKHRAAGADFEVLNDDDTRLMWVEAIAVRPGTGADKVPEMVYNGTAMNVPEEEMVLRIASGLDTKHKKYLADLQKELISPEDPYVIALDRSELGHVEMPPSLILKALFGIGHMTLSFPVPQPGEKPRQAEPTHGWSMRPEITKKSGEPVKLLFFQDPANEGISAVIYSIDHVIGVPRDPKEMGEHFIVVHNPYARNPLPSSALPFGEEYRVDGDFVRRTRERAKYKKPSPFEHLGEPDEYGS